jgi:hypothetical protein
MSLVIDTEIFVHPLDVLPLRVGHGFEFFSANSATPAGFQGLMQFADARPVFLKPPF